MSTRYVTPKRGLPLAWSQTVDKPYGFLSFSADAPRWYFSNRPFSKAQKPGQVFIYFEFNRREKKMLKGPESTLSP